MPKTIVILGTERTGKSTLFNRLIRKYSLEKDKKTTPIVNYVEKIIKIENQNYRLIDTPPFPLAPQTVIEKASREQINELLTQSDLICWLINQIDEKTLSLNRILRKYPLPRILIFNQMEREVGEENFSARSVLGADHSFFLATLTEKNLEPLTKKIVELLPSPDKVEPTTESLKINLLIFGPPNSGKSTLMNHLLQKNRSLVTPLAGTTQEPVISQWNWKETFSGASESKVINFQLVDTAGITKKGLVLRGWWKNCELAWAIVDATAPLTKQILQIVNLGEKFSKPLVIVVNKSDLVKNKPTQVEIETELRKRLKSFSYVPLIFLSALNGTNISLLLKTSAKMLQKSHQKFGKRELDNQIQKIVNDNPPPTFSGHKLKIYFAKHEAGPAHYFIFFVNNPLWVHFAYQRYLVNRLRQNLGLEHLPIRIIFRKSV
ncbi:MAG: 50S ribosome-binding GTPase [Candidatus Moeniiplasma glomeromycotorum]|nr:50S ribosome-binding GTPase [Candidatus Moeniiplasma glomeromycotorum]MCE8162377.1 50S ribosome-binding GTPase [Candidatus Moeniiplasma glomeromycotorum]MCE8166301.1 50S ribosome-binding GTPase [Candidatus Moeniiplasma glomeromycotorum]MCE8166783.1 50S ribosome-binding GTPase [Candidatus Moeniiplasma glomeromycotorum]